MCPAGMASYAGNWLHSHSAMTAGRVKATAASLVEYRFCRPSAMASAAVSGVAMASRRRFEFRVSMVGGRG